jgi:hypothetical protein
MLGSRNWEKIARLYWASTSKSIPLVFLELYAGFYSRAMVVVITITNNLFEVMFCIGTNIFQTVV